MESFDGAGDPAAVEAELASMRAELTRSLVDTDAVLAGERRDRAAAEERAVRAEQLRGEADADAEAARQDATSARADAEQARARRRHGAAGGGRRMSTGPWRPPRP